jgi:signal transduction histidine kinase
MKEVCSTYLQIGNYYLHTNDFLESIKYYEFAEQEAIKLNDKQREAQAKFNIAYSYSMNGNLPDALKYLILLINDEMPKIDKGIYEKAIGRIGYIYLEVGDIEKASYYNIENLKLMEINGDTIGIITALYNLGDLHHSQKEYLKALDYFQQALSLAEKTKDERWQFTCLLVIGLAYSEMSMFEKAEINLNQAYGMAKRTNYVFGEAYALLNLGSNFYRSLQFKEAIEKLDKALELSKILKNVTIESYCYLFRGNSNKKLGNFEIAISDLEKALKITSDIHALKDRIDVLKALSETYALSGQFSKAFQYQSQYLSLKDSLFNEEKYRIISTLEIQYDVQKKENEIALLQAEKERDYLIQLFFAAGAVMLLILAYVLFGRYRLQRRTNLELQSKNDEIEVKNEKLAASNTALEQFAYVASHDMSEPLRMIGNYTKLLQHRYKDALDEDAAEFIEYINDAVDRMGILLKDLLDLSRLSSRKPAFESVDLNEIFEIVTTTLRNRIEEEQASVSIAPLPEIEASRSQMIQLFQNLLSNAIKFRGEAHPRIYVESVKSPTGTVSIAVKDNGIGIAPVYQKKIFNIFQRLHTQLEYDGTGIGLAISKKIVEIHKGEIYVESEPGLGSTFFVTLPIKHTVEAVPARIAGYEHTT